jgi:hypothetical protein
MRGTINFSMGCHSGYSVFDAFAPPATELDYPQALARNQAWWVGNTGFGYGMDDSSAFTERLMEILSERLVSRPGMPVGVALMQAKRQYLGEAASGGFGTYDEKAMIESTLYGLPTYRVSVPNPGLGARSATPSRVTVHSTVATEVETQEVHLEHLSLSIDYDPVHTTAHGQFYTIEGLAQTSPGRPIQPKFSIELADVPGQEPHGVLALAGQSTTERAFDPVIARPVPSTTLTIQEPAFTAPNWFPARMFALNRQGVGIEESVPGHLVVVPAQFRGTQHVGQERRFTQLDIAVCYSDSPDRTPPVIWHVAVAPEDGRSLSVFAGDASGIEQVWATYSTDGDVWQSIELVYSAYTERWEGMLPESESIIFIVQAMDSAGNTTWSGNKGQFFGPAEGETAVYLPLILNEAQ